jgi:hypothetical protein
MLGLNCSLLNREFILINVPKALASTICVSLPCNLLIQKLHDILWCWDVPTVRCLRLWEKLMSWGLYSMIFLCSFTRWCRWVGEDQNWFLSCARYFRSLLYCAWTFILLRPVCGPSEPHSTRPPWETWSGLINCITRGTSWLIHVTYMAYVFRRHLWRS